MDTYIFLDGDIEFPINPSDLRKKVVERFKEIGVKASDDLVIYVTGLTLALTAVIRIAFTNCMTLTLMLYDNTSGNYIEDVIFSPNNVCHDIEYPAWVACP